MKVETVVRRSTDDVGADETKGEYEMARFILMNRDSGVNVALSEIDDAVCKEFDRKPHKKLNSPQYDLMIGIAMACLMNEGGYILTEEMLTKQKQRALSSMGQDKFTEHEEKIFAVMKRIFIDEHEFKAWR